jgi:predicted DNA-binding transcriptional regulator AlpA
MSHPGRPKPSSQPAKDRPYLLTAEQVGQHLLQVPASSVRDYARRKHNPMPHRYVGRHLRFLEIEVLAWVDGQSRKAA